MDVRGKLVELLKTLPTRNGQTDLEDIADHLIANGVTVQEWISVKDMMPDAGGYVVCIAKRNPFSRFMPMVARIDKNGWVNPITEQYISEVTHWMPIPSTDGLYAAHDVAIILADAFGDDCACNFNGNDEWLPYLCELQDACPHPCGVACWEQYLKYKDRKEEIFKKYGFTLEAKYKEA